MTVANDDTARTVHIIEMAELENKPEPVYTGTLEVEDGVDDKGATKWKAFDGQTMTGAWYIVESYKPVWKEADQQYCGLALGGKLESAPAAAGTYVYRVSYEGDEKEFAGSYADIVIHVETAEIVVRPVIPDKVVFYDRQSVKDVLAQITYDLPYADGRLDKDNKAALYPVKENMWGTSYDNKDLTQPYKPDFDLIEIVKDKDGKEISRETYNSTASYKLLQIGNEYIVRFNGDKVVYDASGAPVRKIGINTGADSMNPDTCGFKVRTGSDVYEQHELKIEVKEANQKINVEAIRDAAVKGGMNPESFGVLQDAYTKTYDGAKAFINYADYKKAKLESGSSDSNRDFEYSWRKSDYSCDDLTETVKVDDKEEFAVSEEELKGSFNNPAEAVSPANAGVYRLEIKYKDPSGKSFAEPAYVYFVIRKQEITFTFNKTGLVGNATNSESEFLENHVKELIDGSAISVTEAMAGKPTRSEDWKNYNAIQETEESADYIYKVNWAIKEKRKKLDAEGKEVDDLDADGKPQYDAIGSYSMLTESTDKYFLTIDSIELMPYLNKQNFEVKQEVLVPVTVEKMGEAEINFAGITTVDGNTVVKVKTYDAKSVYDLVKDYLPIFNTPITVKEDGKTEDTKVIFAEGEEGLTYTVEYNYGDKVEKYGQLPTEEAEWAWTKNAGDYKIRVNFGGNKNYSPLNVMLAEITVSPKGLILTVPALTKTFEAGKDGVFRVLYAAKSAFGEPEFAGVRAAEGEIPTEDMKYFTKSEINASGSVGYPAWYDEDDGLSVPSFVLYDKAEDYSYDWGDSNILLQGAGSERYMLTYGGESGLAGDCAVNYNIIKAEPVKGTPVEVKRGPSKVKVADYCYGSLDITDKVIDGAAGTDFAKEHQVTIQDGIAYFNGNEEIEKEGNLVKVTVEVPAEYQSDYSYGFDWSNVIYEKSIRNAAGKNLVGDIDAGGEGDYNLTFTYDATEAVKDKKDLTFSIRWAQDYNEKFTILFSTAKGLGNLKDAVAPKSLAFNAPLTSMVVGQEQDLNVKITKEQNADIICLGYRVIAGKDKMHVNEYGKVTALAEGKATVEVYPMHLENGKKTDIPGAKTAKVNITVKKVSAPKLSKAVAGDTNVSVQYALPKQDDGYRREIYVVEGKNVKAAEIEAKVQSMKNEQWQGIFAVAPVFLNYSAEYSHRIYDTRKHAYTSTVGYSINSLKPTTDYTVYVRNVSAMRSFEDGCKVSLSYAGNVKSFKTTLIQVSGISATLKDRDKDIREINGGSLEEGYEPTIDEIRGASEIGYEVPLTDKTVQISLEGLFLDEAKDKHYEPLALSKEAKKSYADPKIAYYFWSYIYDGYDALTGRHIIEEDGYTTTSALAAIDKKGKVTLKQPGDVLIYAVDTTTGYCSQLLKIHITAEADSMKAKKVNMQVGQSIRLENMVEYMQGRIKLDQSCYNTYGRIDVKAAQEALGTNENFGISDGGYLTAYGVGSVTLKLTDRNFVQPITVNVQAKSKALDPVKNLKAVNVIDNRFDVQFEMNPYADAYRIEIENAKKKTIRSIYVENIPFIDGLPVISVLDDEGKWVQVKDDNYADDDWGWSSEWEDNFAHNGEHWYRSDAPCRSDKIKGKWTLTYRIKNLTQSSRYNVKVTALYGESDPSKTVSKAVATTKMPAYDIAITSKIEADKTYAAGMNIQVVDYANGSGYLSSSSHFVSGNTYSLKAKEGNGSDGGYNKGARYAGTDTLTWSSSNKSVASVKATAGGYSATMKALKSGKTVIEVKSKVLKSVIARYTVTVSAVGDAYLGRDYWGDNEDLRGEDDGKQPVVTEMTVGVPIPLEVNEGQSDSFKFKFTAMEEGRYQFSKIVNGRKTAINYLSWSKSNNNSESFSGEWYVESLPFTGSVVIERSGSTNENGIGNRTALKLDETVKVKSGAWYVFTAPEEGLYGFKRGNYIYSEIFNVYRQNMAKAAGQNTTYPELQQPFYELKKDEIVYLKARSAYSGVKVEKASFVPLASGSGVTVSSQSESWFEFTPAEMDHYEFRWPMSSNMDLWIYDASFSNITGECRKGSINDYDKNEQGYVCQLGQKVYVQVRNYTNTATMSVTKKGVFQKFAADGTYTVNDRTFESSSDYLYITYVVPEDGFYTFACDAAESSVSGQMRLYKADNMNNNIGSSSLSGTISNRFLNKGEEVCLQIWANNYPVTWNNVKFTVTASGAKPTPVNVGETADGKVSSAAAVWYSFTAPETARYAVSFPAMENATSSIYVGCYKDPNGLSLGNNASVSLSRGGYMKSIVIGAGETRYIKVEGYSSTEQEFKLSVNRISPDKTVNADAPADLKDFDNWISFTADADGYYGFGITKNVNKVSNYLYAYRNITDTSYIAYENISGDELLKVVLSQGETIWINATLNSSLAENETPDQITVRKLGDVNERSLSKEVWTDFTFVADGDAKYVIVKCTAKQNGDYMFFCENDNVNRLSVYNSCVLEQEFSGAQICVG